jgi:cytochrome c
MMLGGAMRFAWLVLVALTALGAMPGAALAQSGHAEDLSRLPASRQVTRVSYCAGQYRVRLGDGAARDYKEYDLSFKTDSTALGPPAGTPALVPTGSLGDRAIVVFARPEELRAMLDPTC